MDLRILVVPGQVEAALEAYLAGTDDGEVMATARAYQALPFWRDFGGVLYLQPDGAILASGWESPGHVEPVADLRPNRDVLHAARGCASRDLPSIEGLCPVRPADAVPCPGCDGTGVITPWGAGHPNIRCGCGGLGWLPEAPAPFQIPPRGSGWTRFKAATRLIPARLTAWWHNLAHYGRLFGHPAHSIKRLIVPAGRFGSLPRYPVLSTAPGTPRSALIEGRIVPARGHSMTQKLKTHPSAPLISLAKVPTGITGFDQITFGGLPLGRTTLVRGGPGCGKTVFAVQSLVNNARDRKEPGILVAFEENAGQIVANAATLGWDIPALTAKRLFFLDASLSPEMMHAGEFDLNRLLNVLQAVIEESGAKHIVFDGIDVLLRLLDNPVAERREIYRVRDWLSRSGLTAIITQKVGADDDLSAQHYNFMQFMADCVVNLGHQVIAGSGFRNVRVMKYRGSGFLGDEFPITITAAGIQVTNRGPVELQYGVSKERISSGLARLDAMLCGGYYRGSNVLISGAPGTAKSTLAGLFVAAACSRGERAMYVNFDEGASQITRNLSSVGIRLAPHQKSGLLKIYSTRTRGPNIEDQFGELRRLIQAHKPTCLVVDPLSALSSKLAHIASADATQMFLDYLKAEGVTVVNTSLLDGPDVGEATATGISTIADTWIHLSYIVHEGERNRALTIVKSRGTGHSNQVRELTLSDAGVSLTDVFTAQGQVLMGVARWEREQMERAAKQQAIRISEIARVKLNSAQAEAAARLKAITTEMKLREAEIALLSVEMATASDLRATDRLALRKLRRADEEPAPPKRNGKHGHAPKVGGRLAKT